jgi:hypothetical protein
VILHCVCLIQQIVCSSPICDTLRVRSKNKVHKLISHQSSTSHSLLDFSGTHKPSPNLGSGRCGGPRKPRPRRNMHTVTCKHRAAPTISPLRRSNVAPSPHLPPSTQRQAKTWRQLGRLQGGKRWSARVALARDSHMQLMIMLPCLAGGFGERSILGCGTVPASHSPPSPGHPSPCGVSGVLQWHRRRRWSVRAWTGGWQMLCGKGP